MITSRGNMALVSVVTTSVMAFNCGFLVTLNRARDAGFEWAFDLGPNRWMAEAQCTHDALWRAEHAHPVR